MPLPVITIYHGLPSTVIPITGSNNCYFIFYLLMVNHLETNGHSWGLVEARTLVLVRLSWKGVTWDRTNMVL